MHLGLCGQYVISLGVLGIETFCPHVFWCIVATNLLRAFLNPLNNCVSFKTISSLNIVFKYNIIHANSLEGMAKICCMYRTEQYVICLGISAMQKWNKIMLLEVQIYIAQLKVCQNLIRRYFSTIPVVPA